VIKKKKEMIVGSMDMIIFGVIRSVKTVVLMVVKIGKNVQIDDCGKHGYDSFWCWTVGENCGSDGFL